MTINEYGVTTVELTRNDWMAGFLKMKETERMEKFYQILSQIGERCYPPVRIEKKMKYPFDCHGYYWCNYLLFWRSIEIPAFLPRRTDEMTRLANNLINDIIAKSVYCLPEKDWVPDKRLRLFFEDVISILNENSASFEVYSCKYNEAIYIKSDLFKKENDDDGVLRIGMTRHPGCPLNLYRSSRKKRAELFPDGIPVMEIGFVPKREFYNKDSFIRALNEWKLKI